MKIEYTFYMWFYIAIAIIFLWIADSWLKNPDRLIKNSDRRAALFYNFAIEKMDQELEEDKNYKNKVQKETYEQEVEKRQKVKQMLKTYELLKDKFQNDSLKKLEIANDWLVYCHSIDSREDFSVDDFTHDIKEKSLFRTEVLEKRFDYLLNQYQVL